MEQLLSQTQSTLESECKAYCEVVNCTLTANEKRFPTHLRSDYLPLTPANFLERCRDGVLMAHLLAGLAPHTASHLAQLQIPPKLHSADSSAAPVAASGASSAMSHYFMCTANVEIVLGPMAKACGIVVVNIGPGDIVEMRRECVLAVLWQIVRAQLLCRASVLSTPELVVLVEPEETLEDLISEKPENVLIRWVNFHLRHSTQNTASKRQLRSIPRDLVDCQIYALLMAEVAPQIINAEAMARFNRCEHFTTKSHTIVEFSMLLGCNQYLEAGDIVQGNAKLTLAFLSEIFNRHIGISLENLSPDHYDVPRINQLLEHLKTRKAQAL